MSCLSCGSKKQAEFTAEMLIHFVGLKNIDKPGVWLFPELLVCLDCGFLQSTVPAPELRSLAVGISYSCDHIENQKERHHDNASRP
jgi:hypothetical protein